MPTAKRKRALAQTEVVIPEKIYFRIGEVSSLAKLPTYVLRFWETEFSQLRPTKSSTGQRMYRRRDVEFVMQIRKLLYEDGFTIAGARERLREEAGRLREESGRQRGEEAQRQQETTTPDRSPQAEGGGGRAPGRASVPAEPRASQQPGLPFPVPPFSEEGKKALLELRQQLWELIELLS